MFLMIALLLACTFHPIGGFTNIKGANSAEVAQLVAQGLGLPQYSERFLKHDISGSLLITLSPEDLSKELGGARP